MSQLLIIFFLTVSISNIIHCMDRQSNLTSHSKTTKSLNESQIVNCATHSLITATQQKDLALVKQLLKSKTCDPNETNSFGNTALHCAVFLGHEKIVNCLLKHPSTDTSCVNKQNQTALMLIDRLLPNDLYFVIFARQELDIFAKKNAHYLIFNNNEIAQQLKSPAVKKMLTEAAQLTIKQTNENLKNSLQPELSVTLTLVKKRLIFYINYPGTIITTRR